MTDLQLLTLPQAAEKLGVSTSTVERLIKRGALVPIRPTGGKPRLTSLELERYVRDAQQRAWAAEEALQTEIRSIFSHGGSRAESATRTKRKARVSR